MIDFGRPWLGVLTMANYYLPWAPMVDYGHVATSLTYVELLHFSMVVSHCYIHQGLCFIMMIVKGYVWLQHSLILMSHYAILIHWLMSNCYVPHWFGYIAMFPKGYVIFLWHSWRVMLRVMFICNVSKSLWYILIYMWLVDLCGIYVFLFNYFSLWCSSRVISNLWCSLMFMSHCVGLMSNFNVP
jgi:hypothetical protein